MDALIVALSKYVTHYVLRAGFPYYNLTPTHREGFPSSTILRRASSSVELRLGNHHQYPAVNSTRCFCQVVAS